MQKGGRDVNDTHHFDGLIVGAVAGIQEMTVKWGHYKKDKICCR